MCRPSLAGLAGRQSAYLVRPRQLLQTREAPLCRSCSLTWQDLGAPADHKATAMLSVPDRDSSALASQLHTRRPWGSGSGWLRAALPLFPLQTGLWPAVPAQLTGPSVTQGVLTSEKGRTSTRAGKWLVGDGSRQMTCETRREPSRAASEKTEVQRGGRARAQGPPAPHLLRRTSAAGTAAPLCAQGRGGRVRAGTSLLVRCRDKSLRSSRVLMENPYVLTGSHTAARSPCARVSSRGLAAEGHGQRHASRQTQNLATTNSDMLSFS